MGAEGHQAPRFQPDHAWSHFQLLSPPPPPPLPALSLPFSCLLLPPSLLLPSLHVPPAATLSCGGDSRRGLWSVDVGGNAWGAW